MTLERITVDSERMNGEPCIRDLRITVRRVLEALSAYPDRAEFKREYPDIDDEDIRQALAYHSLNPSPDAGEATESQAVSSPHETVQTLEVVEHWSFIQLVPFQWFSRHDVEKTIEKVRVSN